MKIHYFLAIACVTLYPTFSQAASIAVGGFDTSRQGALSFATNTSLQSAISGQFPGSTYSSTATLTPAYLSTVSAVVLSVGTSNSTGVVPLSTAEQTALVNFVKSGGTALILTDNSTFDSTAPVVNNSFLTPFGLSAGGTLSGFQSSKIVNSTNPVVSGIAGTATGFDTDYPGWFSSLGAATELAALTTNNEPDLAVLMPGALGVGSGAVVFFADGNNIGGGPLGYPAILNSANDKTLILNSLEFATTSTPEPTSALLVLSALAGIIAYVRSAKS